MVYAFLVWYNWLYKEVKPMNEETENKETEVVETPDLSEIIKEIADIKGLITNMQEIIDTLQPAKEEATEEAAEETVPEEPEDDEDLGDLFKD